IRDNLDKPSVIRLTLSYIRMHSLLKAEASEETNMYLRILEGFVMVISTEGDMIYLSDNVGKYMGLTQTELMGHNIFEFTHPCDHEEIRNNLRLTAGVCVYVCRDFVMRIKSALTHRGRSTNLKSATWKVGEKQQPLEFPLFSQHCQTSELSCLLLTCQPLPLSHTLLSTYTFTSQHSMDMRFTYCDQRVTLLLGYSPEELLGRSIYDLCHTLDTSCLTKNHLNLCFKSQSVSGQYRMLVKGGGYVWVESHSAVIPSVRPSKSRPGAHQPLCILCVTYILRCVCVCVCDEGCSRLCSPHISSFVMMMFTSGQDLNLSNTLVYDQKPVKLIPFLSASVLHVCYIHTMPADYEVQKPEPDQKNILKTS
uniref:PAS domain-containing protein n=1 Tax=Lates calcarifer TaxID=8187 RepID=A0A4W6EKC2_LATCA